MQKENIEALIGLDNKEEKRAIEYGSTSKDVGFVSLTKIKEEFYNFFKFDSIIKTVKPLVVGGAIFMSVNSTCFSQYPEKFKCENNKWGIKNKETNKILVDCKYDFISGFLLGLALVKIKDDLGLIDETGKELVSPQYRSISFYFMDDLLRVCKDFRYGFIDKTGQEVVPVIYNYADERFKDGKARV